jgi:hypothetical protein
VGQRLTLRLKYMDLQLSFSSVMIDCDIFGNAHNVFGCPPYEVTLQTNEDIDVGLELFLE